MEVMQDSLRKVIAHVERNIVLPAVHLGPEHDYASLPLCVIDAVYSIGVNYTGTRNTVKRWCQFAGWKMLRSEGGPEHTISDFLQSINGLSDEHLAAEVFHNRQRTSSKSGRLKSEAVRKFAEVLGGQRVETFAGMRSDDAVSRVEPMIKLIAGQKSGISFDYFMILAGSDEYIKADRMVCRFIADALGVSAIKPEDAKGLFLAAAGKLRRDYPNVTPRALDNAVWNFQRGGRRDAQANTTCREPL